MELNTSNDQNIPDLEPAEYNINDIVQWIAYYTACQLEFRQKIDYKDLYDTKILIIEAIDMLPLSTLRENIIIRGSTPFPKKDLIDILCEHVITVKAERANKSLQELQLKANDLLQSRFVESEAVLHTINTDIKQTISRK